MDDKHEFKEGDFVCCQITESFFIVGEVLYTPVATGDCWHIMEDDSKRLYYIQSFLYMFEADRKDE